MAPVTTASDERNAESGCVPCCIQHRVLYVIVETSFCASRCTDRLAMFIGLKNSNVDLPLCLRT